MQLVEEPKTHGLSREELIREFIKTKRRSQELTSELRWLASSLAAIAGRERPNEKTVYVGEGQEVVKVTFGEETEYDPGQMFIVNDLLGKEKFDELFNTKVEFTAKKRALNKFLKTVSSDERVETAKSLIRDAMRTEDKSPYVQIVE